MGGSALLAILLLVLPKFLSRESYGYYQLYLFYTTYFSYLSFGIADGLFLRFSGHALNTIPRRVVSGHIRALSLCAGVVFGCIVIIVWVGGAHGAAFSAIAIGCVSTFFYLVRSLITFVYQAANNASLYARATLLERLIHVALAAGLVLLGYRGFVLLLWTDVVARAIGLVYTASVARGFVLAKPLPLGENLAQVRESIRGGMFISLSALATVLVTAVARFAAERGFGIGVFAELSLAFSLQNTILTVIAPISLVVLPGIRRLPASRFREIYLKGFQRMMPLLMLTLAAYGPLWLFVSLWVPSYKSLPVFVGALMPVVIYESRARVFAIPFLQALRRERALATANVVCLALAVCLAWLSVKVAESPVTLVLSLTAVVVVRALVLEFLTQHHLGISRTWPTVAELAVTACFLAVASGYAPRIFWLLTVVLWIAYLYGSRKGLGEMLHQARRSLQRS